MRRFGYTLATSQAGKVALVTGANTGIGRVTAVELARHGAHVILVCRSLAKTQPVLDEIAAVAPPGTPPAECWEAELGSLASTKQVAERFLASGLPLHLLINNAGFAGEQPVTADVRPRRVAHQLTRRAATGPRAAVSGQLSLALCADGDAAAGHQAHARRAHRQRELGRAHERAPPRLEQAHRARGHDDHGRHGALL
eukprot:Unigene2003_Nuclearia_a/m.6242 Unigene2003_Nuclearia_a/g.6242  ORF Unigene2003_Nuclearia_a/g.6242 Unigene2003_Nuclearia_a/m.6242 type:complete len:198 (-) Unigene2003_Nuclearia_a:394-987(-)